LDIWTSSFEKALFSSFALFLHCVIGLVEVSVFELLEYSGYKSLAIAGKDLEKQFFSLV
jgi:hypothetical protein